MRTTRVRLAAAAIACLGGGVLVAAPTGALAASHSHHAPAPKHHPKKHHPKPKPDHSKGFFIGTKTSAEKVTNFRTPSALVRDDNGGLHVVTTQPSNSDPSKGHIVYLTRHAGATKWLARVVPGLRPLAGGIQVESHLSTDDRRVFAVFYECDGVYVADAAIGAGRLPELTQVVAEDNCATASPTSDSPPVARAIPLADHKIGILLPDPAQGGADAIFTGTPGGTFTPGTAVPTTDNFAPQQMTVDQATDTVLLVGEGSDGTNRGIYVVTQPGFSDTWTSPKLVASLGSPTNDYTVEAAVIFRNHKYIGLLRPASSGAHPKHSLFLVVGTTSGQWNGAIALPHTNGHDTALRLVMNTDRGHLHAVWTRVNASSKTKKSGLMHQARNDHGWVKPTFITHWYRDTATQFTLSGAYHPIIGYNQN